MSRKSSRYGWIMAFFLLGTAAGCSGRQEPYQSAEEELVVYCPHPLDFIYPIVAEFESRTGICVQVQTGGTAELLKMASEGGKPACDVFWGGSLSSTLPARGLFLNYISANEDMVLQEFKNQEGNMSRFTDVPSVLMVNENLTGEIQIEGYEDLLQPSLKGRIAMCDPEVSSSAYEHLINMLYAMGDGDPEAGWDYVKRLCENLDGCLLESSSQVYEGVARGQYAVGLTFEEGGARYAAEGEAVRLVYMEEGVISTPDVVCIMKNTDRLQEAAAFVDFVTGKDAQAVISSRMNRRSVRRDVDPPADLPSKEEIHIIYGQAEKDSESREQWASRFKEIFQEAGR